MPKLFPEIEPYASGMLDVGDGNHVYWETCGNPYGKPAVVVHGGPGSGASPVWRRYFDPEAYRVVLFDQRGCGRSTPHLSDPAASLEHNTTHHLIADMELLREHLGVDRWLLYGGSWGSTLGLAYAEAHPDRVTEMVLISVVGTSYDEVDWVTRQMRRFHPAAWRRFAAAVPDADGDLSAAYARLLADPDPAVREHAAVEWCTWEDTHVTVRGEVKPDPRYADPRFRMAFARLVTHYWSNAGFLEDDQLVRDAGKLAGIPGVLVHGRMDVSSPPEFAWRMAQAWPDAELVLIDDAGHGLGHPDAAAAVRAAIDRFAARS